MPVALSCVRILLMRGTTKVANFAFFWDFSIVKNYAFFFLLVNNSPPHEGLLHQIRGDFTKAMVCFEKALEIEPDYHHAWNNKV